MTDISLSSLTKAGYIKSVSGLYLRSWRRCESPQRQHRHYTRCRVADSEVYHRVCLQSNYGGEYNISRGERQGLCRSYLAEESSC